MKNKLALIIVFVLLAGVAAYFVLNKKNSSVTNNQPTQSATQSPNVFTSIKDALSKSLSLVCGFTDDQGRMTKSYIKNGAVRADVTGKTAQESGSVIVKDKKMYYWTDDKKTAFTMDLTDQQLSGQAVPTGTSGQPQQQNVMAMLEKYKNACKPGVVSDSLFVPPTDVKFSDMTQLLKAVPSVPQTTPGLQMTQQQIQDLMKKYAPSEAPATQENQ